MQPYDHIETQYFGRRLPYYVVTIDHGIPDITDILSWIQDITVTCAPMHKNCTVLSLAIIPIFITGSITAYQTHWSTMQNNRTKSDFIYF